jgi:hypothetical protein
VTNVDHRGFYELCMILHGRQDELNKTNASWLPSVISLVPDYVCTGPCILVAGWFLNSYVDNVDRRGYLFRIGLSIGSVIAMAKLLNFRKLFWRATSDAIHKYTKNDLVFFTHSSLLKHIENDVISKSCSRLNRSTK